MAALSIPRVHAIEGESPNRHARSTNDSQSRTSPKLSETTRCYLSFFLFFFFDTADVALASFNLPWIPEVFSLASGEELQSE